MQYSTYEFFNPSSFVVGVLGTVSKSLERKIKDFEIRGRVETRQGIFFFFLDLVKLVTNMEH